MTTVRVRIFAGYTISRFSRIVLHPRNLLLGYICARDLKYTCVHTCKISCMSSGDDDDLDRILEGPMTNKLVAMTELSPQQPGCSQNPLCVVQAPSNDASSTAELPPRERRTGELRGSGHFQGPCLSLADALPSPHLCITSHVKNAGILCTPTKIYTREN